MLPFDNNRSIPTVQGPSGSSDVDYAMERCMERLMKAFEGKSLKEACTAFKDLMALTDIDDSDDY